MTETEPRKPERNFSRTEPKGTQSQTDPSLSRGHVEVIIGYLRENQFRDKQVSG